MVAVSCVRVWRVTCVSECVYMYARVFRFLRASINIARGADAKFQIYGQEFAGTPFVMLILIYVFHVKEMKNDPPLPPPIPFASLLFPLLSSKISSRAISIDSADVKCLVRARVLRCVSLAVPFLDWPDNRKPIQKDAEAGTRIQKIR